MTILKLDLSLSEKFDVYFLLSTNYGVSPLLEFFHCRGSIVSSHVSAPTPADYSAIGDDAFLHLRYRIISPILLSISLGLPVS